MRLIRGAKGRVWELEPIATTPFLSMGWDLIFSKPISLFNSLQTSHWLNTPSSYWTTTNQLICFFSLLSNKCSEFIKCLHQDKMKIFSWMQNKLNGKPETKKPTVTPQKNNILKESKEEFSDWPHGLLAIGTFGNNEEAQKSDPEEDPSSSEDQLDFTPEEVGKLQKELTKLLSTKPVDSECKGNKDITNLPLDRFLNCPSTLEVDRTNCHTFCEDSDEKDPERRHSTSVVLNKGKDVATSDNNNNNVIHKKSVSFLLKKIFVCRSGFALSPSLRDQMPESRMEKLLRAILHKKIHPPSPKASSTTKKYLEHRHSSKTNVEDQMEEKRDSSCKWVKTDSEYIVLEI